MKKATVLMSFALALALLVGLGSLLTGSETAVTVTAAAPADVYQIALSPPSGAANLGANPYTQDHAIGLAFPNEGPLSPMPPMPSNATGNVYGSGITFDTATNQLSFDFAYGSAFGFTDLRGDFSGVHIHGPSAVNYPSNNSNAGVLFDLGSYHTAAGTRSGRITGTLTLNSTQAQYLIDNELYINIHTAFSPGGEIRGQLIIMEQPASDGIIYVDQAATGSATGLNWTDAFTNVQDGLAATASGDEIWVARGVYYPDIGAGQIDDSLTATFQLPAGVGLYGGFAGDEMMRSSRDWNANSTVLSGDIDQNDVTSSAGVITNTDNINGSNAYRVVQADNVTETAVFDGFTVTGGYAVDSNHDTGAGLALWSSYPTLANLHIIGNGGRDTGAGLYYDQNNVNNVLSLTNVTFENNVVNEALGMEMRLVPSNPSAAAGGLYAEGSTVMTDVVFIGNSSTNDGGGIYLFEGTHTWTNVTFLKNEATLDGGGLFIEEVPVTMTNVIFSGNKARNGGGFYHDGDANPVSLNHVTLSGNRATANGGAIYNLGTNTMIVNSIIWNNATSSGLYTTTSSIYNFSSNIVISHSLIANSGGSGSGWDSGVGNDGGSNLDTDPLFITAASPYFAPTANGDYRLAAASPAVDTADAGACATADIRDTGRPQHNGCDMGAYEYELAYRYYVDQDATGDATGITWTHAFTNVQDALTLASAGVEIWVADGLYYPDVGGGNSDNERTAAFEIPDGANLYGGFTGAITETALTQRDWAANLTILSGDIDQNDGTDANGIIIDTTAITGSNAYNVVRLENHGQTAVMDGFTVTGGYADGNNWPYSYGAGLNLSAAYPLLSNLTIIGNASSDIGAGIARTGGGSAVMTMTNVAIMNNKADEMLGMYTRVPLNPNAAGGGMYNCGSLTLQDVSFIGNSTTTDGGGLYSDCGTMIISNTLFSGNSATLNGGGYMNEYSDDNFIYNTVFRGNSALNGGGLYNDADDTTLTHVTFSGNAASTSGGAIYNRTANMNVVNSIIWNNMDSNGTLTTTSSLYSTGGTVVISSSLIANSGGSGSWNGALGTDSGGNLDSDPYFATVVDPAAAPTSEGNLALRPASAAVDSSHSALCTSTDLRAIGRPQNSGCDMGAYERIAFVLTGTLVTSTTVNFNWTDTGYGPYTSYFSSTPYTGYGAGLSGYPGTAFSVPTAGGDPDDPLYVEIVADEIEEVTNRVGVFAFAIEPGN